MMDHQRAVSLIRSRRPDTRLIYLFGSRARGDSHPASDVDVAILAASELAPLERFDLQEALAALLGCNVDLVDLRAASTVLRVQVLEHGRVLFEVDPDERARFEMIALSAYTRLNEARRHILEDVKARGTVHG